MNSTWGKNIRISLFGESHGECIGIVVDGVKSGIKLDNEYITKMMQRRAPGKTKFSTPRAEADAVQIKTGVQGGITTGAPICGIIENSNTKSGDYENLKSLMRPGHSDYPAYVKFGGFNDVRGGGHFSGRLTAPIVFAGSICRQILKDMGIEIVSHISEIAGIQDDTIDETKINDYINLTNETFPVINKSKGEEMKEAIEKARMGQNSVGGCVECVISGINAGIGNPIFHSVESVISSMMFSIPAVKGIEFGAGFDIAKMTGQQANDEYYYDGKDVKAYTNNNGGIIGGITNGMPIKFKVAIKPTPSISLPQKTVNVKTGENGEIVVEGRHDPCIVPRAAVVVESAAAIAILDLILENS